MPRDAIGLDIGGANLKAATAAGEALSVPFELWRHPDRLAAELGRIRERWPNPSRAAVTMTGELCDCFETKRDGVRHILAAVEQVFGSNHARVWSLASCFVGLERASNSPLTVAAANWHGLATYAGRLAPRGPALLVDTGSTTTDIIPLRDGEPVSLGQTDADRLRSGELIYTGVRRTPVCALLGDFVAAEWFATTQDVYVLLGRLAEEPSNHDTCDSRPLTRPHAHARLSRMLGGDPEVTSWAETTDLAQRVFRRQQSRIGDGIVRAVGRLEGFPASVILSGSGEFLARQSWELFHGRTGGAPISILSLTARLGPAVSGAACAYALAVLASEATEWD